MAMFEHEDIPEFYRPKLKLLVSDYLLHRSASKLVTETARLLGSDLTALLLRKLAEFLVDAQDIFVAIDEHGQTDCSLVVTTSSTGAEILDLRDGHGDMLPPIRSTSDLRSLLSNPQSAEKALISLTVSWTSCVMELLQLETRNPPSNDQKRQCFRHLRFLSKEHGVLPASFYLHDIIRQSDRALSGGTFCDVWQGHWQGQLVCLKVLRLFSTPEHRAKTIKQFCRESLVWKQLNHPSVLPLLGVNTELFAPGFCLVSPWMSHGNLLTFLEKNPKHDRLKAMLEVAQGMEYLHSFDPPVVHADIRGANILVTDKLVCCLADFGLARVAESQVFTTTTSLNAGTVRWMAPEVLLPCGHIEIQPQRDVYAFGCTVLEVFTAKPPFHQYPHDITVSTMVITGRRPQRPAEILSDGLWRLVEQCWAAGAVDRPTSQCIVSSLQRLKDEEEAIESSTAPGDSCSSTSPLSITPTSSPTLTTSPVPSLLDDCQEERSDSDVDTPSNSPQHSHLESALGQRVTPTKRHSQCTTRWAIPPRVLLVDDDPFSLKLSSKYLQIVGCMVDVAADGISAYNKMNLEKYDLVLMDIAMPKLDGASATSLIRKADSFRKFDHITPIISMTSNLKPDEIMTYYSSGMNDVLPKPFTKQDLLNVLEKHLMHLKVAADSPSDSNSAPTIVASPETCDEDASAIGLSEKQYDVILQNIVNLVPLPHTCDPPRLPQVI